MSFQFSAPVAWKGPHDRVCKCGCGRTFRVTQQNPRQAYYSEDCRNKTYNANQRAKQRAAKKRRLPEAS